MLCVFLSLSDSDNFMIETKRAKNWILTLLALLHTVKAANLYTDVCFFSLFAQSHTRVTRLIRLRVINSFHACKPTWTRDFSFCSLGPGSSSRRAQDVDIDHDWNDDVHLLPFLADR